MTDPNNPTGAAIPPYDGRRESADVKGEEELRKDGANVGGAAAPIESDEMKSPPKEDTPRGVEASPADEQPASGARARRTVFGARALPLLTPPALRSLRCHASTTSGVMSRTLRAPSAGRTYFSAWFR